MLSASIGAWVIDHLVVAAVPGVLVAITTIGYRDQRQHLRRRSELVAGFERAARPSLAVNLPERIPALQVRLADELPDLARSAGDCGFVECARILRVAQRQAGYSGEQTDGETDLLDRAGRIYDDEFIGRPIFYGKHQLDDLTKAFELGKQYARALAMTYQLVVLALDSLERGEVRGRGIRRLYTALEGRLSRADPFLEHAPSIRVALTGRISRLRSMAGGAVPIPSAEEVYRINAGFEDTLEVLGGTIKYQGDFIDKFARVVNGSSDPPSGKP